MARAGNKRFEVALRRERVAEMYLQGMSQNQIAKQIGMSQKSISNDIVEIRTQWVNSSIRDFDAMRGEQLAKIDRVEAEYCAAWERSKANGDDDPRYMQGVERCVDQRCKLLGLNAPVRTEITGANGGAITVQPVTEDQVIERYKEALHRAALVGNDSTEQ
jgi:predicted transcriptional regulator